MNAAADAMDKKHAELTAQGLVRACPWCGNEVWGTCYHDGNDVPAVEMPFEQQEYLELRHGYQLLKGDDWVALYDGGEKVLEGHSLQIEDVLDVVGVRYKSWEVKPEGFPADDLGPGDPDAWTGNEFPERLEP